MWHFCVQSISGAEMSNTHWHWCRSVSDFYGGAEMSNGHFGTSAEMSWVRSVLGPKCPYTSTAVDLQLWTVSWPTDPNMHVSMWNHGKCSRYCPLLITSLNVTAPANPKPSQKLTRMLIEVIKWTFTNFLSKPNLVSEENPARKLTVPNFA